MWDGRLVVRITLSNARLIRQFLRTRHPTTVPSLPGLTITATPLRLWKALKQLLYGLRIAETLECFVFIRTVLPPSQRGSQPSLSFSHVSNLKLFRIARLIFPRMPLPHTHTCRRVVIRLVGTFFLLPNGGR
jgi:hypothetical protein